MAFGRANEAWNHTSSLMALLASIHSGADRGRDPSPADYHPFLDAPPIPEASPELIRSLFPPRKDAASV
jgi:hypothetical protein